MPEVSWQQQGENEQMYLGAILHGSMLIVGAVFADVKMEEQGFQGEIA